MGIMKQRIINSFLQNTPEMLQFFIQLGDEQAVITYVAYGLLQYQRHRLRFSDPAKTL